MEHQPVSLVQNRGWRRAISGNIRLLVWTRDAYAFGPDFYSIK